jgi:hypothetical protein
MLTCHMTPTFQATGLQTTPPEPLEDNPINKRTELTNQDHQSTSHVHPLKKVGNTSLPTSPAQRLTTTQLLMLITLES